MNLNGCLIVLNIDGTEISDDEVLEMVKDQTLILLQSNEIWKPDDSGDNVSDDRTSTLTYQSDSSLSNLTPLSECELTNIENTNIIYDETRIEQPMTLTSCLNDDYVASNQNTIISDGNLTNKIGINQKEDNSQPIFIVVSPPSDNTHVPVNESTWQNFQLPLDKIPKYMIEACEKGATTDRRITTEVIHIVVNQMRGIKTIIPAMAFRHVARQLADKFPICFLDKDEDGTIIGNGTHSTVCRLQDRSNYLNRPHKRKSLDELSPSPVSKVKQLCNRRAGCSDWQPEQNHSSEDDDISRIKAILKTVTENHPDFYTYLEKTYAEQRKYINSISDPNTSTAAQIRDEWPVLYRSSAILWHFKKLTHAQFPDDEEFKNKCNKIFNYGDKKNYELSEHDNPLLKALEVLCLHFNENLGTFLFKFKEVLPTNKDVLEDVSTLEPCIMEIEVNGHKQYYVVLEKTPLSENGETFENVFKQCFALYFNFDLMYPKSFSISLEFIQRYFYKIHPDSGTKSKKKMSNSKKRVITLINSINKLFPK